MSKITNDGLAQATL